jgi:hypothetical protein
MKKKYIVILIAVVFIIGGIGGGIYMDNKNINRKIEINISKEFTKNYLDPEKKEIEEITFYKKPVTQNDATGNRNYYFYINNNPKWKVGASVKVNQEEIWAFGSDDIELIFKEKPTRVKNLEINYSY